MFTSNTLYCQLLINKSSHCILQCYFNLPSPLARDFIADIVCGHNMDDELEPLLQKIRSLTFLLVTNSIIHALRNAQERYGEINLDEIDENRK